MVIPSEVLHWLSMAEQVWADSVQKTFSEPILYVGTAAILLLERCFPVRNGQKTFTLGFFQDTVWLALQSVFWVAIASVYLWYLTGIYTKYFSHLQIPVRDLPVFLRWMVWIVVMDLLDWVHHWLKHKVPWFWKTHEVHHSQREMSLFTDQRHHALDSSISLSILVFPLLILQADWREMVAYMLIHTWYTRLYHARIRTDFGWLRYILVTPQSHRIHHSIETVHYDKNFGTIFSFWDRLFGTQYTGWNEYPEVGIPNKEFPLETSGNPLSLILTPVRQNLYPFISIAKGFFRKTKEGEAVYKVVREGQ